MTERFLLLAILLVIGWQFQRFMTLMDNLGLELAAPRGRSGAAGRPHSSQHAATKRPPVEPVVLQDSEV